MEVSSYLKELNGTGKKKESFFQIFSAIKKLKNYGYGFLNFGEPINLTNYLDQQVPNWRDEQEKSGDKKPKWLTPVVNVLATDVMSRINQTAAVSGMSICAICLLSAKKHAMAQSELIQAIDHFLELLRDAPYSELATLPKISGEKLLENTLKLNKFDISEDSFGKIISLKNQNAVALTYYRNNISHLFALPGLIAAIVFAHKGLAKKQILLMVAKLYPLLKRELFIYMNEDQAAEYTESLLSKMLEMGLFETNKTEIQPPPANSKAFYSSWLLNRSIQETLHRYAVVLTLLSRQEQVSRAELERKSAQFAERLSALHGINSPEFFDKKVLSTFINALKENALIEAGVDGKLRHSEQSEALRTDVINLIAPEIAQRLQQI
jgi:glycerol-3-phosphate O-acyltransferase